MKPNGFDAARAKKATERIDVDMAKPLNGNGDLKLSDLESPEQAIREAIKIGHRYEAGKGDRMECNCTFLEHQLDHVKLKPRMPGYIQDAFDKIVKDLPEDEIEYLKRTYWQR